MSPRITVLLAVHDDSAGGRKRGKNEAFGQQLLQQAAPRGTQRKTRDHFRLPKQ